MTVTVLHSGTQTLIVDKGRPGHRHQGIPGGGAADKLSFAIANHLVGNRWDAPALECALGGLHIRFERVGGLIRCGEALFIYYAFLCHGRQVDMRAPFKSFKPISGCSAKLRRAPP